MIPALDISTSALVAQRTRMDVVSSNLANLSSQVRNANGEMQPYEGKFVVFETDFSGSGFSSFFLIFSACICWYRNASPLSTLA